MLKADKLEELLTANWHKIVDTTALMAFVLQTVRDAKNLTPVDADFPPQGVKITVSRFQPADAGFVLWVEFSVPNGPNQLAVGTTEVRLGENIIEHVRTLGNIYRR